MRKAPASSHRALWTLLSVVVIDLIGFAIVIPILPFYAEEFGASATILGILITCYAVMQFLLAPVWGRLSDRIGRRPVILLTLAGTSLALLFLGLAGSLWALFLARILGGAFGANISVATAYISDLAEDHERTRWMGMIGAAFGVGFVLGPLIGAVLASHGHALPLFAASALAAVNLVYASFSLTEPARHKVAAAADGAPKPALLRNRRILGMCSVYLLFTFGVTQLEVTFAYLMRDRFGYDARQVGLLLTFTAVVMVAIQGGAIRGLAARFGERTLLLAGALLLAISMGVIPWISSVFLLLVPLAVSSVGRGIAHPAMLTLVSEASTPDNRGAVMGVFQSSASLARVASPLVAGLLYDRSIWTPYALGAALMLVVWAIALRIRRAPAAS
jgi:DHA1 family tetracycline resistance protein-like MFS transporter